MPCRLPGEETPRWLEIGGRRLEVDDVVDRWLGPDHRYFKVRAGGAPGEYIPRHDQERDCWELTSFRNAGSILTHPSREEP